MNPFRSIESIKNYLEAQTHRSQIQAEKPAKKKPSPPFVTLSRQAGAGGTSVAEALAERLSSERIGPTETEWIVIDQNLLKEVVDKHKLPEQYTKYMEETFSPTIQTAIEEILAVHPTMSQLVGKINQTILHLATTGNVIIVGRGANFLTRHLEGGLNVRLVGSTRQRLWFMQEYHDLGMEEAQDYLEEKDTGRVKYVKRYFDKDITDPLYYDLVVNTDDWKPRQTAKLIAEALRIKRKGK
jgi:cytidylate kinase